MKLELGGGMRPRGDGWANIDLVPTADIVHDLNVRPWPIADESVSAVYSSHCLEHLQDPHAVLLEIARVCVVGATVELRVPAPGSDLEFVWTHLHCFSPVQAINMDRFFPADFWKLPKRLRLDSIQYEPSILLAEFRTEMPMFADVSDQAVMKWFSRTAHECRFVYTVVENEHGVR
jgi:ubiquinone/menaquinone biosynthesis C-methylase UbiE